MKAFLLAGGLGTRLRPYTEHTPKCLLPIGGRPLLSIWLAFCQRNGIDEVLINTHYLAEQVVAWAEAEKSPVKVHLYYEQTLLGSAGTVRENWEFVANEESFGVFYVDNLVKIDFESAMSFHKIHQDLMTIALFAADQPERCGIVELDSAGRMVEFIEKPKHPKSNLANAGMYIARPGLREYLPDQYPADFGMHVLPKLAGVARGKRLDGYIRDIGTPESYELAQREWADLQVMS